ncbi:His-Xaa-Ser system radical SAM maturase HxsB [Aestuariivirga sp.]|uniref:His-Xaa-Ser system radical SAM maturase HxsB n=1 Tax=Aestuariivirga sp. TaxID=2650926 RepID=UPI0039E610F7
MKTWPLRFRDVQGVGTLFSNDAGNFFASGKDFLNRYALSQLLPQDKEFLQSHGFSYENEEDLAFRSFAYKWLRRQSHAKPLSYVILVPTLRCNLTCTYCQVSRADERAKGYDWDEETCQAAIKFLDALQTDTIKIEFQGGEPLLRVDLLERIRDFCKSRFENARFVVCTNLQHLGPREWNFIEHDDVDVSTSIDGPAIFQSQARTHDAALTQKFFENVSSLLSRKDRSNISALPTIDPLNPPNINDLLATYLAYGFSSIYLRPINNHGFARKRPPSAQVTERWNRYHSDFLEFAIRHNANSQTAVGEYYFSQCLKRILFSGIDNHVDIRNPNLLGEDYILIDFDGRLYPTDEARMLARIGHIDLSIGTVWTGIDESSRGTLNAGSMNNFDPDCVHCVYQPYCGTDIVDDISRYGRVDIPRGSTWFCQRHTALFDKAFELLYRGDAATQQSLASWVGLPVWNREYAKVHA